jgi:hypothetical protein
VRASALENAVEDFKSCVNSAAYILFVMSHNSLTFRDSEPKLQATKNRVLATINSGPRFVVRGDGF